MKSSVQQSVVVERPEDADKEKKKKRRSNRRSKNSSACGLANESRGEGSESIKSGSKTKCFTSAVHSSIKHQGLDQNENQPNRASIVAFNSMPTMRINEQENSGDIESEHILDQVAIDTGVKMHSSSCPEPTAYVGICRPDVGDLLPFQQIEASAQRRLFAPHWSTKAVNEALQKGEAFKALFRVNAHNRLEAYCKIDGVPTDVLISGVVQQNRAVEGDIVIIKVDPLSSWPKMKGSNGSLTNSVRIEDCNALPQVNEVVGSNYKGKDKLVENVDQDSCRSGYEDTMVVTSLTSYNNVNGHHLSASDSSSLGAGGGHTEVTNAVDRFAAIVSSVPSKRPTGRVVAIVEKSSRRDAIVGFLDVKQWFAYWEICRKYENRSKSSFSFSDQECMHLTPTDARFPKMVVFLKDLPNCIKDRLRDGDITVDMELVAAQLTDWSEESPFPLACVSHSFGKGGELGARINSILYENAVNHTDYSPESLSCLPHIPWQVPEEEFGRRKDLRNLCVFTIDPSTATDLDDALSIETLYKGFVRVGVHIADVSYFVLPDTALDKEAQFRSTSVYMLQSKLSMLPEVLSENVGSLNPGVDRLAFSIFWDLNTAGDVIDRWIGRTVIRSCCKLSYEHAQNMIDGMIDLKSPSTLDDLPQLHANFNWVDVIKSVRSLYKLSNILKERRFNQGALSLESCKVSFLLDECGIPYDCMRSGRVDSNYLVEEFMLLANMTAAEVVSRAFPDCALLRRHPEPNMRKLKELEAFCYKHGLELDTSSSGQFHQSLEKIRGKLKDDSVLYDILISYASKPMQLASYFCSGEVKENVSAWGHYALALPLYTHFTSPLRRYPDIVVHRTMSAVIEAESYLNNTSLGKEGMTRCFTGICFNRDAAESLEVQEALSVAALRYRIPCTESLAGVAAYCNERKLACRNVKDACDKLYMWVLLKSKKIFLSEARVLGLGPRFMSVYIHELAIERRIYYDEVEGLAIEWLESTSTLVLNLSTFKRLFKKGGSGNCRSIEEVAWVVNPYDLCVESNVDKCVATFMDDSGLETSVMNPLAKSEKHPETFPLTVRLLSTIPVALHAVGGDDGPLDIGVRLYMSSYFR